MSFPIEIYNTLSHKTKLAIRRKRWRFGKAYEWNPRYRLVARVANQFNLSMDQAYSKLLEIKKHVKQYPQYF